MGFWDLLGSRFGTILLIITTLERIIPQHARYTMSRFFQKVLNLANPYIEITFDEFPTETYGQSKANAAIQTYIGTNFSDRADRLRGHLAMESRRLSLSMDDYEEITDVYVGVNVYWLRSKVLPQSNVINFQNSSMEKRSYVLSFRRKHRRVVMA